MASEAKYWDEQNLDTSRHFCALGSFEPSISAKKFVGHLVEEQRPLRGNILEVGCGIGRNGIWLMEQGFDVICVDFSKVAINAVEKRAKALDIKANLKNFDISRQWPVNKGSQDYVLDFMTSFLLTLPKLKVYLQEVSRVLKPDGRLVLYTLDRSQDTQAQKLLRERPGPVSEPNTYVMPGMGHLERALTEKEIPQYYAPFKLESCELIPRPTRFGNEIFDKYYWFAVLKK